MRGSSSRGLAPINHEEVRDVVKYCLFANFQQRTVLPIASLASLNSVSLVKMDIEASNLE